MFSDTDYQLLLSDAYAEALKSPDPSSQNGALVVWGNTTGLFQTMSKGYNHFYKGIEPEVEDRDEKLRRIEHAERDAIYRAAFNGTTTHGAILVCPWVACVDCARAIIGSGIGVVIHHWDRYMLPSSWKDQINEALGWLEAAGVEVYSYTGPVGFTEPILVSGRLWSPALCEYVTPGQEETKLQRTG